MDKLVDTKNDMVSIGDTGFSIDCSALRAENIVMVVEKDGVLWAEYDPFSGRVAEFDKTEYNRIINEATALKAEQEQVIPMTLERAKTEKKQEINRAYEDIMSPLVTEYPDIETKTWSIQETEANAYMADPTKETPMLSQILVGRNGATGTETMLELCEAVILNSNNFKQIQVYTGYRQRLEKQVNVATTIAEVEEIVWLME